MAGLVVPLPLPLVTVPLVTLGDAEAGAVFGAGGHNSPYRYLLWRIRDASRPVVVFILFNPSTATESELDNTLRCCRGYAERWGFGGFIVLNLYAFRSTDPKRLQLAADPVGPANDAFIRSLPGRPSKIVVAWGAFPNVLKGVEQRKEEVLRMLAGSDLYYLQLTKDDSPHHPRGLRRTLTPTPWVLKELEGGTAKGEAGDGGGRVRPRGRGPRRTCRNASSSSPPLRRR